MMPRLFTADVKISRADLRADAKLQ